MFKLRRVNEVASHQFQLDLEELKNCLLKLPPTQHPSFTANLQKNTQRVEKRLKVLGYPDDAIKDAYASLVEDKDDQELTLMLTLRGVLKPQSNFQQ